MRGGRTNWARPLFLAWILLLAMCPTAIHTPTAGESPLLEVTKLVRYPLPSVPEPVLLGGTLRVVVDAPPTAGNWSLWLDSEFGRLQLHLINSSYVEGDGWVLHLRVPEGIYPALYDLDLKFLRDGVEESYTQPRSVWVLREWPRRLLIGHITDIHLPYGADVLARCVYELNLIHPDLVLVTGDVVDTDTVASGWRYYQQIMGWLEVPSYVLPGNHDHAGDNATNYQRFCGPLYYAVKVGRFLIVALDTMEEGYVTKSQLRWAEKVLKEHPDEVKILGIHHPLFIQSGAINGSWSQIDQLKELLYSSWREHINEAQEFLRLIETYDVRLVFAGHIHRDLNVLYNGRCYFITKNPSGGSLPWGCYQSYGLVEVDCEGRVRVHTYAGKDLFNTPNSIPIGQLTYYYAPVNDGSSAAVSVAIINNQTQPLENLRLTFLTSLKHPVEDYRFYPRSPSRFEVVTTDKGHLFIAYVNVSAQSGLYLTLAAVQDSAKPSIGVEVVGDIREGVPITLLIRASDGGWGVRGVHVEYSTDGGLSWVGAGKSLSLKVSRDEYQVDYLTVEYKAWIPGQPPGTELRVRVRAWDFANNTEMVEEAYLVWPPPPPTYTLKVESTPIQVNITVDGKNHTTPCTIPLTMGNYTIEAPAIVTAAGKTYSFAEWGDGVTSPQRLITLTKNITLTIHYLEVTPTPETPTPAPPLIPSIGQVVLLAVAIAAAALVTAVILARKRR